jgi:hypothetical protein
MNDVCGIWEAPLPASGTLARIFEELEAAEQHPFFMSARPTEGEVHGDPVVVVFYEDDDDWSWDIYWSGEQS